MAEPVAAPSGVAVSGRDVLLATKLHVPGLQRGFVSRPRLAGAFGAEPVPGLVLVCAPAGCGKTLLLADWARSGHHPAAWLSLDAGDNDPARFWRHVIAALDRVRPGIAERTGPLFGPPAPPSFEGLATALINELAAQPGEGEALLILDDYHVIDAPAVHASVTFLLEHLPPGLHLVLASRADPPLPLSRMRATGQLAELRAAELRFTPDETAALLRESADADLPSEAVAALAARTEGWVAGLQLAALSLRGQPDVSGFVAAFSGSHRYVLDYLAEEVLEQQTGQVRSFLLETSVLDRLSGELCDAVTGRDGSQAMLEQVERAGLFLVPLDEVRGWWRYHHLFADLLRSRLHQQDPARAAVLHRNAAAWADRHDLADDAVRHALAAGDATWAARLIEEHFDALFYQRGEGATVQRWLAALPAALAGSRPRLLLAQALLALASGQVEAADAPLDAAERALAEAGDEPFESTVGRDSWLLNVPATVRTQRAYLAALRGDAERTASSASRALAEIAGDEWMVESVARWNLALAEWLHGRLAEAEDGLSSPIAQRRVGERGLAVVMRDHLAQVQRARGRLDAAHRTYQRTLAMTAPPGGPVMPGAGAAHVGLAEVAYQRNELDTALRHLNEGMPLCRQFVYAPPLAAGLMRLAWIRHARADPDGAREAMGEAVRAAPGLAVASVINPVPAQAARLRLAQGQAAAAVRFTHERGLDPDDKPRYPHELDYLVLARVLIAEDRPGQAVALLERLLSASVSQDRTGSVIEIQALRALALAASGQERTAVSCLAEALSLAYPQRYVRVFADEGAPMGALLARLVAAQKNDELAAARQVPLGYLAQLLRALGEQPAATAAQKDTTAAVAGLVDQLTPRELEVLALVAAGTSNPRIAEDLVVTLDTVKKHVSHVLGKLGAANRTEAVTRARQLGLIP